MVLLPWVVTTFLPLEMTVGKCCSDSVQRTLVGSKPDAALTHVQSLWYVLQAEVCLQLHVAHLVDGAT